MSPRAVVIGAGVAGLAAAAGLQRQGVNVTVLERDPPAPRRRSVPQAGQLHNILLRAQVELERLFPGFADVAVAQGAASALVASETLVWEFGLAMPRRDLGFQLLSATRPQIESALTTLLPREVTIRRGTAVDGLLVASRRVTGVRAGSETFAADLVVDASGSASRMASWLQAAGLASPTVEATPVDRFYVTMDVRRPPQLDGSPDFWLLFDDGPEVRGLLMSPLGPEHWRLSASGAGALRPPRDLAGFMRHAHVFAASGVPDVLQACVARGPAQTFRKHDVRRVRYDLLEQPAEGLMVLGDGAASLNPLLGQGMSVASWQASQLQVGRSAREHHQDMAACVDAAISLTQLGSQEVVGSASGPRSGAEHFAALARAVRHDEGLHETYVRMWHLMASVDELRRPDLVDRLRAS